MKNENRKIFNIDLDFDKSVSHAVELFHSGKVFIYPTDTIYGFGGNPFNERVIARINSIKKRTVFTGDESKQFIWLISDLENLFNYGTTKINKHIKLLENLWPAPISIILKLNYKTKNITGFDTVAFRIPANDFCMKVLKKIKLPLISTSVNRTGQNASNDLQKIILEFGDKVDAIFLSERKNKQIASTIIDLTGESPKLIREGAIKFVELLDKFN